MKTITLSEKDFEAVFEAAGLGDKHTARVMWDEADRMAEAGDIEAENEKRLEAYEAEQRAAALAERRGALLEAQITAGYTSPQQRSFKREAPATGDVVPGPLEVVFSQIDAYKDDGRTVEAFASAEDADEESKRLGNPDGDNYFPGRYTLSTPEEAAEAFHAERVHPSELETALAARGWYKTVRQQVEAMHRAKKRQRFDFGV